MINEKIALNQNLMLSCSLLSPVYAYQFDLPGSANNYKILELIYMTVGRFGELNRQITVAIPDINLV